MVGHQPRPVLVLRPEQAELLAADMHSELAADMAAAEHKSAECHMVLADLEPVDDLRAKR